MTPFELKILLHYFACCDDHPVVSQNPPIWKDTLDEFRAADLLRDRTNSDLGEAFLVLTPRGQAFVTALMKVPLPEHSWIVRWPDVTVMGH
jgi:hypothetical protein